MKRLLARSFPGLYRQLGLVKHRLRLGGGEGPQVFATIFEKNFWRGSNSRSGRGSDLTQTKTIRETLPRLVQEFGVRSMLDLPCGDFHWLSNVELKLDKYIGGDIVERLVAANMDTYGNAARTFFVCDIRSDALPKVDLVMSRDCLVHLSFDDIHRALRNINRSGAKYLLTTTFVERQKNVDIRTGEWRTLNLQAAPFNLAPPIKFINEQCTESDKDGVYSDKCLGLWSLPL
jgi:hypothetical protein